MFASVQPIFQSTHPRGVRRSYRLSHLPDCRISIHAPTRGATHYSKPGRKRTYISIHAPTRGATVARTYFLFPLPYFNPRTHEGCDSLKSIVKFLIPLFQSTHPRGVRPAIKAGVLSCIIISIHAPTRGATAFFSLFLLLKDTANHFLKSFVSFSSFYYELVARFLCPALNLISL